MIQMKSLGPQVMLAQGGDDRHLVAVTTPSANTKQSIDVVFPVLHGPMGEDGTVQGMLKLLGLPFVGPSVLGSAVGMDKDVMKRLLRDAQIPIAEYIMIRKGQTVVASEVFKKLGATVFVKPANMGSSVGVSKAKTEPQLIAALAEAFKYDHKVLIEEAIVGREIECSVLGNENPKASLPGEVINQTEFYSYDAKYIDPNAATTKIPADLPADLVKKCQALAIKTFQALECEGMGRVDFFLKSDGQFVVNEINTIPGFTKISMYPKMWEATGLSYSALIDELIHLAIQRHKRDTQLKNKPELGAGGFKA
jgi:D-alanine-D-alanine ligase